MAKTTYTLEYAVEIDSGTTKSIPALGMTNGLIKFITGNGSTTGLKYEDNSTASNFKKGFLVKNAFRGISKSIDLEQAGSFASSNTMSFTINNVNTYDYQLDQNEVFLTNASVKIYIVLDGILYQRWTGTVNNMSWDTTQFVFSCKDYDATLFKALPTDPTKPVVLGNVSYAKLVKEDMPSTSSSLTEITSVVGARYFESTDNNNKTVVTLEVIVSEDFYNTYQDTDALKNLYVRPRQFGVIQTRTDSYGDAVRVTGSSDNGSVIMFDDGGSKFYFSLLLYLESPFTDIISEDMVEVYDFSTQVTENSSIMMYNGDVSKEKYEFDIIRFATKYYVSNTVVGDIEVDSDGTPITYIYDEKTDTYIKSNAVIEYVTPLTGTPYFNLKANSDSISVNTFSVIRPDSYVTATQPTCDSTGYEGSVAFYNWNQTPLVAKRITDWDAGAYTTIGANEALTDPSYDTFVQFDCAKWIDATNASLTHYDMGAYFKVQMPTDFVFEDYDGISLGMAFTCVHQGVNDENYTSPELNVSTYDTVDNRYRLVKGGVTTQISKPVLINPPINDMYFSIANKNTNYDINNYTQAFRDGYLSSFPMGGDPLNPYYPYTIFPKCKVALTLEEAVDKNTDNFDGKVVFGQYYKRNSDSEYIEAEQNFIEQMAITNNPIVTENGIKYIYLWMNVQPSDLQGSGGSGGVNTRWNFTWFLYDLHFITKKTVSSQDIYVKTTGEQVDGADVDNVYATMKYMFETFNGVPANKIDYSNLPTDRVQWDTSRYIGEQQSSQELIIDLARQSFVGIFVDRMGKFKLNAWRDNKALPSYIHNEETISNGSIKYASQSSQNYVYNDMTLSYSQNYAKNAYADTLFIHSTSSPAFDTSFTNIPDATTAEVLWNVCNDSFYKTKVLKPLTSELGECNWYRDLREFDSNATGTMNQSIMRYLNNLVYWNTQQKNVISYSIPLTPDNIKIELLDKVEFSDPFITYNIPIYGTVTSYEIDTVENNINIEIITESRYILASPEIIDEDTPDILSIIDEDTVSTTNIIDEVFSL